MSNRRWRITLARCRALLGRRARERDLDEEIADHLERLAAEARGRGATDAAARAEAQRRFGDVARTREGYRQQLGFARLEACWLDLRLAARALARRPLLLVAASVSIAIGVGLNLGVYATLTRVLFGTSLSGAAPDDRLLAITGEISYPNYQDLARVDALAGVAAMQVTRVAWRADEGTVRVGAKVVSANFFDVVGVRPAYGRTFAGDADIHTAVLGFGFWQRRFAGDPSAIGRTLTFNGWPYVAIGVMPREFNAPVAPMVASDIYLPIGPQICLGLSNRAAPQFDLVARLKDGVAPAQARAAVASAAAELERRYPRENERFASAIQIQPLSGLGFWRGMLGGSMVLVLAAASTIYAVVGLVLLVACANVAGLLLARAAERGREVSIRIALGATRARIVQQFLAESFVIAIVGCAAGALACLAVTAALP
ncbi:MAG TPA: ABC transporter permease, partial [Vicinamibacterales bacterium]|nr:ABC transporter permease [Vicinamibacterales bacterium]